MSVMSRAKLLRRRVGLPSSNPNWYRSDSAGSCVTRFSVAFLAFLKMFGEVCENVDRVLRNQVPLEDPCQSSDCLLRVSQDFTFLAK